MMNNKAQAELIIIAVIFVCFVVAGGIVYYTMNTVTAEVKADPDISTQDLTPITKAETSFKILEWGPILILVALFISLFISYFYIGSNGGFFIVHFIILIICGISAGIFSNMYYDLTLDPDLGTVYAVDFVLPNYVMQNFPAIIIILGFVSMVILLSKYSYDKINSSQAGGYV